jgi:hypothetical protein
MEHPQCEMIHPWSPQCDELSNANPEKCAKTPTYTPTIPPVLQQGARHRPCSQFSIMNDRKTSPNNEVVENAESPTTEFVREALRGLDPEILHMDMEDAPTVKL